MRSRRRRPIVLEPIARLAVTVPTPSVGDITGHRAAIRGRIVGTDAAGPGSAARARARAARGARRIRRPTLKSLTGGEGLYIVELDHYAAGAARRAEGARRGVSSASRRVARTRAGRRASLRPALESVSAKVSAAAQLEQSKSLLVSARDQQIRALYKAALERPAAERASFIADLSGGDHELCRSVELMLSRHGATDIGASSEPTADPPGELASGTQIGNYRIDGVLGRGGMGVVYRATDTKLHRPVAIKFLVVAADEQAKRRFRQEAETASALNHPHIVTVYDVGEHDGQQYIVSELVEGGASRRVVENDASKELAAERRVAHGRCRRARGRARGRRAAPRREARQRAHRCERLREAHRLRAREARRSRRSERRSREDLTRLRARGSCSARSLTCRRSRLRANRSTSAATCSRSASCSTSSLRVIGRSKPATSSSS